MLILKLVCVLIRKYMEEKQFVGSSSVCFYFTRCDGLFPTWWSQNDNNILRDNQAATNWKEGFINTWKTLDISENIALYGKLILLLLCGCSVITFENFRYIILRIRYMPYTLFVTLLKLSCKPISQYQERIQLLNMQNCTVRGVTKKVFSAEKRIYRRDVKGKSSFGSWQWSEKIDNTTTIRRQNFTEIAVQSGAADLQKGELGAGRFWGEGRAFTMERCPRRAIPIRMQGKEKLSLCLFFITPTAIRWKSMRDGSFNIR